MPLSKTGAAFWMNIPARFDLEMTEDVLAPRIKKIVAYEAARASSPHEQSDMRGSAQPKPGCRFAHPG
jgi:hypothetical protein